MAEMPTLDTALAALKGKTVALDFDVPIHSYVSGWTGPVPIDPPTRGALEMVRALLDAHVSVIIYTTRAETPEGAAATVEWLAEHGFPPVPVTAGKPLAVAYIDDRAVPFTGSWVQSVRAASLLVDGARLDSNGDTQ